MNMYDFYMGRVSDAYEYLEAHVSGSGVIFRTYAPNTASSGSQVRCHRPFWLCFSRQRLDEKTQCHAWSAAEHLRNASGVMEAEI